MESTSSNIQQKEEERWICPYKCLSCKKEHHPELYVVIETVDKKMTMNEESSDDERYRKVGAEGSLLARLRKPKEQKKKNWDAGSRRPEPFRPFLDVDSAAFDFVGGFGPGIENRKKQEKASPKNKSGAGSSKKMEEVKKEKPRVERCLLPGSGDFSKPLSHWAKPETLQEVKDRLDEMKTKRKEEAKAKRQAK